MKLLKMWKKIILKNKKNILEIIKFYSIYNISLNNFKNSDWNVNRKNFEIIN